jgi:hypothetical protein
VIGSLAVTTGGAPVIAGVGVASVASAEYWDDAQRAGGTSAVIGRSVAVAADGRVLVTGSFVGTAYFPTSAEDSIALTSNGGNSDVFVAALNKGDSYFAWAQRAGGTGGDEGNSVAVAADGTLLVTGFFSGTAYFPTSAVADDSIALTSAGNRDVFVAALNKDDSYFAWAQRAGSTGSNVDDRGLSVAVAADDTVIITGFFAGTAYFPTGAVADDSIALTSAAGSRDIFVAALNKDDSYFAWAQRAGGTDSDEGKSVAVAADGTVLITGQFKDTASFPTRASGPVVLTSAGGDDAFVAALNKDDSYFAWAQRAGGTDGVIGQSVAVAADGTVLVTGDIRGTANFPTSAEDSIALTSAGAADAFVAALNKDDSYFAWAQRAGGTLNSQGNSVAVAADGTVLVTGFFAGTADFPAGAVADDSIALTSFGGFNVFVAALNKDDSYFAWAQRAGSTSSAPDQGRSVAVAADGRVLITGDFQSTAYFPASVVADDSIALTSAGGSDMFVGWLLTPLAPPVPPGPAVPAGAPTGVSGEAGDGMVSVSWAAPVSSGSFAITNYQVMASPGGRGCVVAAPTVGCKVSGLINGTAYTFAVRALTGAGWGPYSAPSDEVTPSVPVAKSILIVGSRVVANPRRIEVEGTSTGLVGQQVTPWLRFPGQTSFVAGVGARTVDAEGKFTWSRRAAKRTAVYFAADDIKSNTVIIRAR